MAFRLAHGVSQGVLSDMQGQSFRSGFWGGVAGKHGFKFGSMAEDVVASALIGGVAAELGGGDFKDGARSAAFVRLFNHWGSHNNEDKSLSDSATDDGYLTLKETNAHARVGKGTALTVDAEKLTVEVVGVYGRGRYKAIVKGINDFLVHGNVVLSRNLEGAYSIDSELYDFDFKPLNSIKTYIRNVETDWARHIAGYSKHELVPFKIHYEGSPNIIWNQ